MTVVIIIPMFGTHATILDRRWPISAMFAIFIVFVIFRFGVFHLDADLTVMALDFDDDGSHGSVGKGEVELDAVVYGDRIGDSDAVKGRDQNV